MVKAIDQPSGAIAAGFIEGGKCYAWCDSLSTEILLLTDGDDDDAWREAWERLLAKRDIVRGVLPPNMRADYRVPPPLDGAVWLVKRACPHPACLGGWLYTHGEPKSKHSDCTDGHIHELVRADAGTLPGGEIS